jgi:hypothetical protein
VIADTSAWIEYLRATGSRTHLRIHAALVRKELIWVPDVVLQELLQGARNAAHFVRLELQLERLPALGGLSSRDLARDAALLYARCRWRGLTIRSPNDCLVAACAIASDMPLLAHDRDFSAIARVEPRLQLL